MQITFLSHIEYIFCVFLVLYLKNHVLNSHKIMKKSLNTVILLAFVLFHDVSHATLILLYYTSTLTLQTSLLANNHMHFGCHMRDIH